MSKKYNLLPYPVILAATKGDSLAMDEVVHHYEGYICKLATRPFHDENGATYNIVDESMRQRLESKLMSSILRFRAE